MNLLLPKNDYLECQIRGIQQNEQYNFLDARRSETMVCLYGLTKETCKETIIFFYFSLVLVLGIFAVEGFFVCSISDLDVLKMLGT